MKKWFSWLDENLEEFLMIILLAIISCVTMFQVIMRYCLKGALPWPEEFCRFCFVYTGCLSAGYCLRKGATIRVDVLINFFPRPVKILLDYAGKLLTLFIYAVLFYYSFDLIARTTTLSTAMRIPFKVIYAGFPVGLGLGCIRAVQDLIVYSRETFQKGGKSAC